MNKIKKFAQKWGALPSITITILLIVLAVYWWIAAERVPIPDNMLVNNAALRAQAYMWGSVFAGIFAAVNGVLLAWTRLPWRRVAQVGSAVNIVLGIVTIPAIIGIVFIYNGLVGLLRFAERNK